LANNHFIFRFLADKRRTFTLLQ